MYRIDEEYIVRLRREYHQYPELNFNLIKTLQITKRELEKLDISYSERFGRSSLAATLGPEKARKTIALRADMDALPITEKTNLPFSSRHLGRMHACGHDCHMAMLLGTAKALKEIEEKLPCNVKLIFQAAEEAEGGAEKMCLDGVMEDVDEILACHVAPDLDTGKIAIKSGAVNASSDPFDITFFGKRSHIAKPHLGNDAILMANFLINNLQSTISAKTDPLCRVLIGIGKIQGGSARNIVCNEVKIEGTIRSHDESARNLAKENLVKLSKLSADLFGGSVAIDFLPSYPSVFNSESVANRIATICKNAFGEKALLPQKSRMGAEDFSFYLKEKQGAIFDLGVRKKGKESAPLHSDKFDPDENALKIAPKIFIEYLLSQ